MRVLACERRLHSTYGSDVPCLIVAQIRREVESLL